MEPETLSISRECIQDQPKSISNGEKVSKERYPGDGMECYTIDDHFKLSTISYKTINKRRKKTAAQKSTKLPKTILLDTPSNLVTSTEENSLQFPIRNEQEEELLITIDTLETRLKFCESHNNQLIEEKMKLSQQLGIQTQVNNELKKLLVASIGEDLQHKYERLLLDKSQSDLELKHMHNMLEEDREEVEQAMIQADVWRSKFLASRVMSDELSRWKSALYYKYKESYHALQNLLEEHSKIRALNNATKRGLTKAVELLNCKDASLDLQLPLTTIDVAFMNNDLVNSLLEIMTENNRKPKKDEKVLITITKSQNEKTIQNEVYKEASQLTHAEQLAHEVIVNTAIETEELCRMRNDYLAHNRISHFLSTNYHVTFNCCETCKGPIKIV